MLDERLACLKNQSEREGSALGNFKQGVAPIRKIEDPEHRHFQPTCVREATHHPIKPPFPSGLHLGFKLI